jgi:hypothetical protein
LTTMLSQRPLSWFWAFSTSSSEICPFSHSIVGKVIRHNAFQFTFSILVELYYFNECVNYVRIDILFLWKKCVHVGNDFISFHYKWHHFIAWSFLTILCVNHPLTLT